MCTLIPYAIIPLSSHPPLPSHPLPYVHVIPPPPPPLLSSPSDYTERSSFWGDRRDYYHYLTEHLSNLKDLEVVAKKILGFPQVLKESRTSLKYMYAICGWAECVPPLPLPSPPAPPLLMSFLPVDNSPGQGEGSSATLSDRGEAGGLHSECS